MIALTNSEPTETSEMALTNEPAPPSSAGELGPSDILHGIRRRGLLAAIIGLPIAILVAVGVFVSQPPKFRASALLRLSSQETSLVFRSSGAEGTEFEIFQGTQRELVLTRLVMVAALRNMADSSVLRMERPVDWMLENVRVETPKDTEIMMISSVATEDQDPAEIVNATVDAYRVEVVNRERDTRQSRLTGIEAVFDDKSREMRKKRNELKQMAEQLGTGDAETLSIKQQLLVEELGLIRQQLIKLQTNRWATEAELRSLQVALENEQSESAQEDITPTEAEIDSAIARDGIYNELVRDKVTTFRLQSDAKSAFKSESKSPFDKVQSQIAIEMEERRNQIKEELAAFAPLRRKARAKVIEQRIGELTAESDVLDRLLAQLTEDEKRLMSEFKAIGNQSIDIEMMRSEIQQLDAVLASIAQQREELKVEIQSRPRVEILRKAEESMPADLVKRAGVAGFSGMLAFAFPIIVFLFFDLISGRVNSSSSLSSRTGLKILGTLPIIPNTIIRRLGNEKNRRARAWRTRLDESVKRISSRISLPAEQNGEITVPIFAVTSAMRGEGKTTVANQVATSLACSSRKVILCDFDLRRPRLHQIYGMESSPGVCEVLRGEADLGEAVRETDIANLSVLPSGGCCPQAIQALVEEKAEPLLKELRTMADIIIIDACPVLASADIGYICPHIDYVVFSARRDYSRTPHLKKALELIPAMEHQIAGAIVIEKCSEQVDMAGMN